MNTYYHELATVVYDQFDIEPYEKIIHRNFFLTVEDYIIGTSIHDPIKNIMFLLRSFSTTHQAVAFIHSAVSHIIEETLKENRHFADFYKYRIKQLEHPFL